MKICTLSEMPTSQVSHNPEITKRLMINASVVPHLTNFSQAVFKPNQKTVMHAHASMFEVFFVQSGKGYVKVGDIVYPLVAGNCVTIEPGDQHELGNSGEGDLVVLYFGIAA
jgi:quercetin dioxygenase-like cupin family protein